MIRYILFNGNSLFEGVLRRENDDVGNLVYHFKLNEKIGNCEKIRFCNRIYELKNDVYLKVAIIPDSIIHEWKKTGWKLDVLQDGIWISVNGKLVEQI